MYTGICCTNHSRPIGDPTSHHWLEMVRQLTNGVSGHELD